MEIISTTIEDVKILQPNVYGDERGFFFESFNRDTYHSLGIDIVWVQDNHSRSAAGVIRGLHYQVGASVQDKLVRVVAGAAFDVAVDIRRQSLTFGRWVGIELSAVNKRMLLVPHGFAHGFLALTDGTEILYKCSYVYDPAAERGIAWNDPALAIDWPLLTSPLLISSRDRDWPCLSTLHKMELF